MADIPANDVEMLTIIDVGAVPEQNGSGRLNQCLQVGFRNRKKGSGSYPLSKLARHNHISLVLVVSLIQATINNTGA